jgi:hypothetical protein
MDTQSLSAILLIAGFAVLMLHTLLTLPGLYQTTDPYRRVQIIEEYKTRWNINQALGGSVLLLTAAAFVVLALHLRTVTNAWIPGLGAAAVIAGAISGGLFVYHQTIDPLSVYQGAYSRMEMLYYWLALAGLLLFGVAFLQGSLPAWLGYVTAGVALVYGIVFLVNGAGFVTPWLVSFLGLVIAIVLLTQ